MYVLSSEEYVSLGLLQVAQAVAFLNTDCKMARVFDLRSLPQASLQVHGNVCLSAVVVTESLDWRLHAFDLLSEWSADGPAGLAAGAFLLPDFYKPEEVRKCAWSTLAQAPPWAVDAWGLGCLVHEAFAGRRLARTEELRDLSCIPVSLHREYQRLLGSAPARRLSPAKLGESALFMNKLVDTVTFLEKLTLKDAAEKEALFRRLPTLLEALPQPLLERKLLPLIAAGLEYGSAPAAALPAMLRCSAGLPPDAFAARALPALLRLFASPDRALRCALLTQLDRYIGVCTAEQAEALFESASSGFTDSTAYLRELTLKSLLQLAPRLSQRTLAGAALKHLARLAVDEEGAIRANTAVCLANIAPLLGAVVAKRVLLNAFTRSMRDPFPPARAAGVAALSATLAFYEVGEAAQRILPALAPLAADADERCRIAALDAAEAVVAALREAHAARHTCGPAEDPLTRPLIAQQKTQLATVASTPASGLLNWAAAAVLGAGAGLAPPTSKHAPAAAEVARAASVAPLRDDHRHVDTTEEDAAEIAARARLGRKVAVTPAAQPTDGWGVEDDDEPMESFSSPPPSADRRPPPKPMTSATKPVPTALPARTTPLPAKAMKLGASKLTTGLDLEELLRD